VFSVIYGSMIASEPKVVNVHDGKYIDTSGIILKNNSLSIEGKSRDNTTISSNFSKNKFMFYIMTTSFLKISTITIFLSNFQTYDYFIYVINGNNNIIFNNIYVTMLYVFFLFLFYYLTPKLWFRRNVCFLTFCC
jgi:hypothetical protein